MENLYRSPVRVYIALFALALWGVWSGLSLPISLFPNSSQPEIVVTIPYGDLSPSEFLQSYGELLEGQLRSTIVQGSRVDKLSADYRDLNVRYRVLFAWGTDGDAALKEIQTLISSASGSWPEEIRLGSSVNNWDESGGFFAVSFYSSKKSLDELYKYLNPVFSPHLVGVNDAEFAVLFNPGRRAIKVLIDPEKMASLRVLPSDIEQALAAANRAYGGGRLSMGDDSWSIEAPRKLKSEKDVQEVSFLSRSGQVVHVRDVAQVRLEIDESSSQYFRTNGTESVILYAKPKPGANIKKMSDQLLEIVKKVTPTLSSDVEYKVLVNPSEFIDASVQNVLHEVFISAGLAVLVLFLFIGSFKNVATAAIEIPLSIILAFILMKLTGVNVNLISLGGLALSAGMNVDASVVVMENIFRHFETKKGILDPQERLKILMQAVGEVRTPVIASTVASVVVFFPLLITQGLTNAILGDLARAVVYSHSMSAIVALVLVPTIRFQLMGAESQFHARSPIESWLERLERSYAWVLRKYLERSSFQIFSVIGVLLSLVLFMTVLIPRLPKELVGRPETDWISLYVNPQATYLPAEFRSIVEKVESDVLDKYADKIDYTFTNMRGTFGEVMMRLKDKKNMKEIWKKVEEDFPSTPTISHWVEPWNPSELRLPDPPDFEVEVTGGNADDRQVVTKDLKLLLDEKNIFQRVFLAPRSSSEKMVRLTPLEPVLREQSMVAGGISLQDLNSYLRVATTGKNVIRMKLEDDTVNVSLELPQNRLKELVDVRALPVGVDKKILPLSSVAQLEVIKKPASIFRRNQNEIHVLSGVVNQSDKGNEKEIQKNAEAVLAQWKTERSSDSKVNVKSVETQVEMNEAIDQLKIAVGVSVILIFITMVIQFGSFFEALLVMIPIPLGLLGVIGSLTLFRSTLSLNSVLGLILLNGIAVANSILIVDFIKRLVEEGMKPAEAAVKACEVRLRPILMTSLTTILGMLPIALGFGEGGKILQPLGVSVSGGLWISLLLTLFLVPAAHVFYLNLRKRS